MVLNMICKVSSNCTYLFCTYLELEFDMDIDVIICCVELVAIVFKFCTCELFYMNNGVDYDMLSSFVSSLSDVYPFKHDGLLPCS